jgi:hypothetical protein
MENHQQHSVHMAWEDRRFNQQRFKARASFRIATAPKLAHLAGSLAQGLHHDCRLDGIGTGVPASSTGRAKCHSAPHIQRRIRYNWDDTGTALRKR